MNRQAFIKFLLALLRCTKGDFDHRTGEKSATRTESQKLSSNPGSAVWCYEI